MYADSPWTLIRRVLANIWDPGSTHGVGSNTRVHPSSVDNDARKDDQNIGKKPMDPTETDVKEVRHPDKDNCMEPPDFSEVQHTTIVEYPDTNEEEATTRM